VLRAAGLPAAEADRQAEMDRQAGAGRQAGARAGLGFLDGLPPEVRALFRL